jgi:6-phosphogluconolactonase (cycloisomerase 2 family)
MKRREALAALLLPALLAACAKHAGSGGPGFAYVANSGESTVSGFALGASGVPMPLQGSPFAAGAIGGVMTTTPNGAYLYVTGAPHRGSISAFAIGADGGLTAVSGAPFAGEPDALFAWPNPSGTFLYVVSEGDRSAAASVSTYAVAAASGALTLHSVSKFQPFHLFTGSTVIPCGGFVQVLDAGFSRRHAVANAGFDALYLGPHTLATYAMNRATGALTKMHEAPFAPQPEGHFMTAGGLCTPNGRFLYVPAVVFRATTTNARSLVLAYAVDPSTGAPKPIRGSPFPALAPPLVSPGESNAAIDPPGKFLYLANDVTPQTLKAGISVYAIDPSTGALTAVAGGTAPLPASGSGSIAVSRDGAFVYVVDLDTSDTVAGFAVDASSGALRSLPGSPFSTGRGPQAVVVR